MTASWSSLTAFGVKTRATTHRLCGPRFGLQRCSMPLQREGNSIGNLEIKEVIRRYSAMLMSIPGVAGVGESLCGPGPCIVVYVEKKSGPAVDQIPGEIGGYPVKVEETGIVRVFPEK